MQVAENLLGQAHRGKRHRHRVLADGRVGAHLLGRIERGLEQPPEQRPDGAGLAGHGIGRLHLAENLRFAQHQRVEPGSDPHHVTNCRIIFMHIGAFAQLVVAQMMIFGQPAQHDVRRQVILFYIEFTAIAGGEDRSFAAVGESAELLQGLNQLLRGKSHALADVY
ncbi:hypothetical protein D3C86_852040 [compost metagenome]